MQDSHSSRIVAVDDDSRFSAWPEYKLNKLLRIKLPKKYLVWYWLLSKSINSILLMLNKIFKHLKIAKIILEIYVINTCVFVNTLEMFCKFVGWGFNKMEWERIPKKVYVNTWLTILFAPESRADSVLFSFFSSNFSSRVANILNSSVSSDLYNMPMIQ